MSASASSQDLAGRVRSWIADDPDPACQAELQALLETGRFGELSERFGSELRFGTAGLRGRIGAGPARMNRATVRRATAGLAEYLRRAVPSAAEAGVVVGHDARHGSARFAEEAERVLTGAGVRALTLLGQVPTPLVAFAVRRLGCAGGIMITASHNRPEDNGYKVYLGDGAQIAPPVDEEIARCIAEVGALSEVPLGSPGDPLGEEMERAYVEAIVAALPAVPAARGEPPLRVVYTPLHGVGRPVLMRAFARTGLPPPCLVEAQADPDPDFPTVVRPNPEEPGTLDLALSEAERRQADLMLANDPDADRLCVAIPDAGRWRVLTGDEVGWLLARHRLARCLHPELAVVVTTVASSTLLSRLAAAAGVAYRETLTGFKWIMRAAAEAAPRRLLLGYEEALGYAVSDVVRDKDGISAALVMCQVALEARREGVTPAAYLDELAQRFGLHATRQVAIELAADGGDVERAGAIMRALRKAPPAILAGRPVVDVEDLLERECLTRSDVLVLRCEDGTRAVVRPSGTEPKLKVYLQVVLEVTGGDVREVRRRAEIELDGLAEEMRRRATA